MNRGISCSLVSAIFAALAVGLALLLSLPWMAARRESARAMICMDRLRTLGRGVYSFESQYDQLPALASDDEGWSWAALIEPHLEDGRQDVPSPLDDPQSAAARAWLASYRQPTLLCPSRRTTAARDDGPFAGGQPSDFVGVSTSDWNLRWSPEGDGVIVYRETPATPRMPPLSGVTFLAIVDGLDHTAMFGEKHMQPDWLGGELDEPAPFAQKGALLERLAGTRAENRRLANDLSDADPWKFGSWHPGAVQFGLASGGARRMSVGADLELLARFTSRNDLLRDPPRPRPQRGDDDPAASDDPALGVDAASTP